MASINEQDLLDEIRFDIKVKDLLKGKLVLSALEHVGRETQKTALLEVSRADDDFAIPLLAGVIANTPGVVESFPFIRETMFSKVLGNPDLISDLLNRHGEPLVRAFLAEIAGEVRLQKSVPVLIRILEREENSNVIKSVITAMGLIGDSAAVPAVSRFLYSDTAEIAEASVNALGEIGSPEAVERLAEKLGGNPDLDHVILDILARIQSPEAFEKLNQTLESRSAHIRAAGKLKLGEIGPMSVRVLMKNLVRDSSNIVIHSLNVLGDIGDRAAIPAIRELLHNEPRDPNVRFAAYEALGRLPLDKGAYVLASGLEDPVDNVRDAAVKAIDNNYNPLLAGGIRNMVRSGDKEAFRIITAVIDSKCDNIFKDLMSEDYFRNSAVGYLSKKAHPDIRLHFSKVLEGTGDRDLSRQVAPEKTTEETERLKVFAIDDSRMILNIYRTVLHNLGCNSRLFEFPADAIKHIWKEKPGLVLTDLNMPEITGIELTCEIRKLFSPDELPVIMVTTQDESRDSDAAYSAGVNSILQKPFTEKQIGRVLAEFT